MRRLNARGLPGVRFETTTFTPEGPGDRMYGGELVKGIRFITTDREVYDPTVTAVAAMLDIRAVHPDRFQVKGPGHMDRLAGNTRVREQIMAGAPLDEITGSWPAQSAAFRQRAQPHLLYR